MRYYMVHVGSESFPFDRPHVHGLVVALMDDDGTLTCQDFANLNLGSTETLMTRDALVNLSGGPEALTAWERGDDSAHLAEERDSMLRFANERVGQDAATRKYLDQLTYAEWEVAPRQTAKGVGIPDSLVEQFIAEPPQPVIEPP